MQTALSFLLVLLAAFTLASSFLRSPPPLSQLSSRKVILYALDEKALQTLDALRTKYEQLSNVATEESDQEAAKLKETVEKYKTYLEVKKLLVKIRNMYRNEASESRKEKQLKSFIDLYKGKTQLEEILKEKLGLPYQKKVDLPEGLAELQKVNNQIETIKAQISKVELKLPTGNRTIYERFGTPQL